MVGHQVEIDKNGRFNDKDRGSRFTIYSTFLKPSTTQYMILTRTNVIRAITTDAIGNPTKPSFTLTLPWLTSNEYVITKLASVITTANLLKPG